jgi:hypothetical protein
MFSPRIRAASLACILPIAAACRADSTGPRISASKLAVVSGDGQTGLVGFTLATPLVVRVSTAGNGAVAGARVNFQVTAGSATVAPTSATTDAAGMAQTQLTLGATAGNVVVTASVEGTSLVTTFLAAIGSASTTTACQSGPATTPAVGQPSVGVSGAGICLGGGTGAAAEYALVAFNSSSVPSSEFSVDVIGRSVNAVPTADIAPAFSATPAFSRLARPARPVRDASFDATLRENAIRVLSPMIGAARGWQRSPAAFTTIPSSVTVGQIVTVNMNATPSQQCTVPLNRGARVAALSNKAVVLADTGNPAGGFTDAEYQSIAVTFDTLIDPLDVQAFGQPTDIDHNGRIVILFTRIVNALTPPGSDSYIGGFFFDRDLFPTGAQNGLAACPASNVGEMFYMLVPDPNGTVNGNKRDKAFVLSESIGTLAHEYQHLINASRRIYINDAADFEEVWLNEGLSHIAEELLFYRASGLSPRQNLNAAALTASTRTTNVFFDDQGSNLDRYAIFLDQTKVTSPYDANDSLATRGATWSFLRWAADHRAVAGDADSWSQLVNSRTSGLDNLRAVFGADVMTQFRDWATTQFTDDLVASDARFQESSWDWRSIFAALRTPAGLPAYPQYPLGVTPLANNVTNAITLRGGASATLRFSVSAGGQGSVDWASRDGSPASPRVQWTLVRTK